MSLKSLIPSLRQMTGALALGLIASQTLAEEVQLDTRYGSVTVDDSAERVITLYEGALDAAVALGVKPVGAITTRQGDNVASYIQPSVEGISIVGTARETNLESVIALQPDLILASSRLSEEQYELLSAVAPTIVPSVNVFQQEGAWKEESKLFAKALGREEEMDKVLDDIAERATGLKDRLDASMPDTGRNASLARWMPQGALLMSNKLFASNVLASLGFEMQTAGIIDENRAHSSPLSLEKLSLIDGDWLFLATLNEDGREAVEAASKSPAFQRLEVVKNDRVVPVDGQLFSSTSGPMAANAILDRLETVIEQTEQ